MSRSRLLIVATAIAVGVFVYYFGAPKTVQSKVATTAVTATAPLPSTGPLPPNLSPSGSTISPQQASLSSSAPAEFVTWLQDEARELNRTRVDGDQKRRELRSRIARITPPEAEHLSRTARSLTASAAEKILSTFLLIEGGLHTQNQLAALIVAPFQETPDYAPHSEEETKGIREKSLRIMAIDGLFSRAQSDPEARRELARVAKEAHEASVRSYATDKLRQLR